MNHEAAVSALFDWLVSKAGGSFETMNRRARFWNQVDAQPALFIRHIGTSDEWVSANLSRTTLECEVWIYSKAGANPDVAPDIALNTLVQAVRTALMPDAVVDDGRCTLGGVVYWARIEGRSDYSPGDNGDQALARIPVRLTLPA
jgi:hypothetical protein